MSDYIETFAVQGRHYGIQKENNRYSSWDGGCCTGNFDTQDGARNRIFKSAISHALQVKKNAEDDLKAAQDVLGKLGNDVFNLGQFKVPNNG